MDLYPSNSDNEMKPVALQDHLVAIHYVKAVLYRRVAFSEPLPPFQAIDLGVLAAGTTSARTNMTNLDLADTEFGQYRFFPLDNMQFRLFVPRGTARGDLKTIQVPIDPSIIYRNPDLSLTETFVWQDNRPAVEALNGQAVALAHTRIIAKGFRYVTDEAANPMTQQEIQAINAMKSELGATVNNYNAAQLMGLAIQQHRVPCVHVWASGLGAGRL